jgi:hypothetical protein
MYSQLEDRLNEVIEAIQSIEEELSLYDDHWSPDLLDIEKASIHYARLQSQLNDLYEKKMEIKNRLYYRD